MGAETMDDFAYLVMQIFTVVLLVGTLGVSFFCREDLEKDKWILSKVKGFLMEAFFFLTFLESLFYIKLVFGN